MARVVLKNLTKKFKDVVAVDNVNIDIADKEFAVLVGPSGCGKSTTLRAIAGLEDVTSGEIYIGDKLVNDIPPKDRDIAMVFQNYALYPHMDVYNNMAFGLKLRKFSKEEIDQRVNEAAEVLGIEKLLKRRPKELSGGQRQRVAVGRAIVRKPKVFLFDEPLSNLDAKLRVAMRTEISKLYHRLGATIIYVTHDQIEAMTMATRIFIMDNGKLQQAGKPLDVYQNPSNQFVAGFIGSPAMNFIPAKLLKENSDYLVDAESIKAKLPADFQKPLSSYVDKQITFGVRPEHFHDKEFFPEAKEGSNIIKATAEVIEPLGDEVLFYLVAGKHNFVAKLDSRTKAQVGDELEIAIDMKETHIFDVKTQDTLV
ncbi:MAG: sn-glycerol-3-phosphate ABC transporter ATP-binding protein UgpC [Candidatus Caldatribacteriota bacterium]|jgi:multiple sugar transport system ATP-binding protein|nr:sn-glycerol-3-phosphate ABC transporter ATP-binding protein UgpC [Atribacterota bacterium]MDD4288419.1 sn-glycerol-3-phosphate ABC transporter ATP-binding protein UgpC [Atribacterota bacterium]